MITGATADTVTTSASTRPWRGARSGRPDWQAGRLRRLSWFLATVAMIAAAVPAVLWYQEPPKRVPRFEAIVDDTPGPVKDFTLADMAGAAHSSDEWANRSGIVLFFLGIHCPVTDAFAPEIARLAGATGSKESPFTGFIASRISRPNRRRPMRRHATCRFRSCLTLTSALPDRPASG